MRDGTITDGWYPRGRNAWWVPVVVGGTLFATSLLHFGSELATIGVTQGPLLAFTLTTMPSVALVLFGIWLRDDNLSEPGQWTVAGWTVAGLVSGVALFGLTIVIRLAEGRVVAEPEFPTLATGAAGALTGAAVGYLLARLREQADSAQQARDVLTFTNRLLRHDVQNALQTIDGRATLLADGEESTASATDTIKEQVAALDELIDDVGAVATIFQDESLPAPTNVVPRIEDVVEHARASHPKATIELTAPERVPVRGTEALGPVVRNLVVNAIEHGPNAPTVAVTIEGTGEQVRVTVADDGPGIPDDLEGRLFERDVSTKRDGGTGLFLARTIVDRLGGQIRVGDSSLGGAEFVIELPPGE